LIVLYPQAMPIAATLNNPGNPRGCWDWWGYSDLPRSREFARKTGYQIAAVKAMIDRLADGSVPGNSVQPFGPPEKVSAADKTSSALALIWQANAGATGFNIARSTSAAGPFVSIANMVTGGSFADTALAADTVYHYQLRAIDASNTVSTPVTLSARTAAAAPACDPFFSDNLTHISNWRAYRALSGEARAVGSHEDMGAATDDVFTQLIKEPGPIPVYRVRYCP
jgi:hypothetical protein